MPKKNPYKKKYKKGMGKQVFKNPWKHGKARRNVGGTTYYSNKKKNK
jgi:hypothetical protein